MAAAGAVPPGAFQQVVAHITSGAFGSGGFVTKLTIVNLGSSSNSVVINNIRQDGTPIDSTSCTIPPNGTLRLTQGTISGTPDTHWALVGSSSPVGVNLFFELTQNNAVVNTVGFNDLAPRTSFTYPVELQNSPFHTLGLAVANPNNSSNTVTVTVLDGTGNTLGSKQQTLPAFGQLAEDLLTSSNPLSIVSFLPQGNFIGSVQVSTSNPASTVGVGDDQGPFFSEAPMFVGSTSSGGTAIAASVTLTTSDAINAGTCIEKGAAATGATTSMVVAISPQGDPTANGLNNVLWNGWVDAPGHVTVQFCKFAKNFAVPTSNQVFNIRVFGSSVGSAGGAVSVPAGTQVVGGGCTLSGGTVSGAAPSNVVVLAPSTDPGNVGWAGVQFQGFVDTPNHVTAELCKFGGATTLVSSAALNFNVALLN